MGLRSYLMVDDGHGFGQLLEANNVLPLLWLCLLSSDHAGALDRFAPTLRLADGPAAGVVIPGPAALANLASRRATLLPWLGEASPAIFDEFAAFLAAQGAQRFCLDMAEWVDAANSHAEAVAELRAVIDALDTPAPASLPAKRRPKQIKWLMEHFDVAGLADDAARFAYMLGGGSQSVREPWRRDRARERRLPTDRLYWSNSDPQVSNNGRTIVAKVKNNEHLETPLVWSRDSNASAPFAIDPSIGHLHVNLVSDDGHALFGNCQQHPGPVEQVFRWDGVRFLGLSDRSRPVAVIHGCTADGALAVGYRGSGKYGDGSDRAFFWQPGVADREFLELDIPSKATHVTPDGAFIAGICTPGNTADAAPERAFVWSEADGMVDVGPSFFYVEWLALSPDGQRGVLRAIGVRGEPAAHLFWRRGEALRPIEDSEGAPLSMLCISRAVDAVLGDFSDEKGAAGAVLVWRPDQALERIAMPGDGALWPLFVADGGRAVVVALNDHATRSERDMLVWTAEDGLRTCPVLHGGEQVAGGFWARNRSATLNGFVAVGKRRRDAFPYIWSVQGGIEMHPGSVELARVN